MDNIKFKNRWYEFQETIVTQLSTDYVPNWNVMHAIRESVQNMVDEKTLSGAHIAWVSEQEGSAVYFYDRGRGVDLKDILYLGVSGKRGVGGVVGQHGEGEIVSFLVAMRCGFEKIMASQDWLITGRTQKDGKYDLLVLDVYKTQKPRKGTAWYYAGAWAYEEFERAFSQFRRNGRRGILADEPGQLYTCGMKVNRIINLALGYDLEMTPGRDRGGFTWEMIKNEVGKLLNDAKAEHVWKLIDASRSAWFDPLELQLNPRIDPKIVKSAIRGQKVAWGSLVKDSAYITDAGGQGISVMLFRKSPPRWVTQNIPNVRVAVGRQKAKVEKELPILLKEAVESVFEFMPHADIVERVVAVFTFSDDQNCVAKARGDDIILARKQIKQESFADFLHTLAHEIAHIFSGQPDCTRGHNQAMGVLLSGAMVKVASDKDAMKAYRRAKRRFEAYVK